MYKLLLVDDEANMRTRMIQRIDWQQYGFEIVCYAENGLDALEKIETYNPDVVITDIKMPFMDGLELSKRVHAKYPLTKIIILTGFDDFKYAKEAINLKVIDYILKPITHDNLVEVLKKTRDQLDREYEEKRDINRLKEYYATSFPIMRNKVLQQLVAGRIPTNQIQDRLDYYNISLPNGPYRVAIMALKDSPDELSAQEFETNKLMLSDIVESIINEREIGVPFVYEDFIVIIISLAKDKEQDNKTVESLLYEIYQYIEKYMSFKVKISVGHKYNSVEEVNNSYNQAKSALDYASDTNSNEILYIWDLEPNSKIRFLNIRKSDATRAIKSCSLQNILEITDLIFSDIVSLNIPSKDYKFYLLEFVLNILKNANIQGVSLDQNNYSQEQVIEFLKKTNSLNELKKWIITLLEFVITEIMTIRNDTNINYVRKAKRYIEENYTDPDLNIDKLCNILFISPNYFSAMFKKSTNMTFTKYITEIRLNKAKELLKSTDKKSFEIAGIIGFSDPNYFSYCFKKNVGLSPSQFRKS